MLQKPRLLLKVIFSNYALFEVFILGIVSGMPFALLYTTLVMMMTDMGLELAVVTGLAVARMPYTLKFCWAPFIDSIKVPVLWRLGRRKSWMLLTMITTTASIVAIALVADEKSFREVQFVAILLGISSATYDIAYDAWRIERLTPKLQSMGVATTTLGYRLGSLLTGAGALYYAGELDNWPLVLISIAVIFGVSILYLLTVFEKPEKKLEELGFDFNRSIVQPGNDLLSRKYSLYILVTIILYKAGEAMLAFVSTPFFYELGFLKQEIAAVVKVFGVIATTIGAYLGGMITYRVGFIRGLFICGILQSFANLIYIWLASQGKDIEALYITVAVDNLTGGMGTAALIGYLGMLCKKDFTATQYALLSSATIFFNNSFTAYSGDLVKLLGWNNFFIFTVLLSLPALGLLLFLGKKIPSEEQKVSY